MSDKKTILVLCTGNSCRSQLFTVHDHAHEVCSVFPFTAQKLHHNFPDPARATGSGDEIMDQFRSVRDQVKAYAHEFVQQEFIVA